LDQHLPISVIIDKTGSGLEQGKKELVFLFLFDVLQVLVKKLGLIGFSEIIRKGQGRRNFIQVILAHLITTVFIDLFGVSKRFGVVGVQINERIVFQADEVVGGLGPTS
jgi:hypothetical protein